MVKVREGDVVEVIGGRNVGERGRVISVPPGGGKVATLRCEGRVLTEPIRLLRPIVDREDRPA